MAHPCRSAYPPGQPQGWGWGLALLCGGILLGQAKPAQAELLYRLDTRCSLQGAAARFSTNTVCFNGSDLCVVNPNYLNSVRQANSSATEGRDLVRVHFGADGRIDASCYDAGCSVVQP